MSKKTGRYGLTYPESGDHTRTWEWWQALAQDTDTALGAYTRWLNINVSGGVALPANVNYGVGPCAVNDGGAVLNAQNDGVNSKTPGLLLWSALFYMPNGGAVRRAWCNPPNENGQFYQMTLGALGDDRFSLSGQAFFTAPGQQCTWGWRSDQGINGNTFNMRGIWLPVQPA